jgi:plasmid stabilization system protein ParE
VARITISWSQDASQHLNQIEDYIARDSPRNAKRVVTRIVRAAQRAKKFPEFGAVVPELNDPAVREVHAFSYRIIYEWRSDLRQVHILDVIHASRVLDRSMLE